MSVCNWVREAEGEERKGDEEKEARMEGRRRNDGGRL